MKPMIIIILALSLCGVARGQSRVMLGANLGAASGYALPYVDLYSQVEQPIGSRFEAQARASFSPSPKDSQHSSQTWQVGGTAIAWATQRFGLTFEARQNWLNTPGYRKSERLYAPGVVFRGVMAGQGARVYIDYLLPAGKYDVATGIEPNRNQGPEFRLEARLWSHVRFVMQIGAYRNLNQGNPLCDGTLGGAVTCARSQTFTGGGVAGIMYEFRSNDPTRRW